MPFAITPNKRSRSKARRRQRNLPKGRSSSLGSSSPVALEVVASPANSSGSPALPAASESFDPTRSQSPELSASLSAKSMGSQGQSQGQSQGRSQSRSQSRSRTRSRSQTKRTPPKPRKPWSMVTLVAVRLIILGIGLGVITGSLLSALDPAYQSIAATDRSSGFKPAPLDLNTQKLSSDTLAPSLPKGASTLSLSQEMTVLKQDVQALAAQQAGLTPGAFILDLDTGAYLDIAGDRVFATASMIKIPVLVAFFQDVDAGKIRLDEELVMRQDLVATEAGSMQYLPVGTKFTALETATEMIRISDNTATNMLIDRLGGIEALNERFKTWGLDYTEINDWLPDLAGTNVSTPRDFVKLMALLNQGGLLSVRSRDRCLSILRTPITDTLLPRGLGEGATIAHKTGDIGSLVGDVGLIDMPNGKRYLAAVMVERPHNDGRAQELIRQISHLTYKFLATTPPASEQSSPTLSPVDNIATEAEPDSPAIMSTYP